MKEIDFSLYAIVDPSVEEEYPLEWFLNEIAEGGVTCLQVRCKKANTRQVLAFARRIIKWASKRNLPVIINDRIDIALVTGSAGVHLGDEDLPISEARKLGGEDLVIGASVRTVKSARRALAEGATYLGVGPVYRSPNKPDVTPIGIEVIRKIASGINLPIVAIGGIRVENVGEVIRAGAAGVAVISALRETPTPRETARSMIEAIRQARGGF